MNENKFIIIKGKAGMGNRILSVLDGLLYSKITNRKLIVDWSDYAYSQDGSNVFYKYFSLPDFYCIENIAKDASVYPTIWTNNLGKSINEIIDKNETNNRRHSRLGVLSKYVASLNRVDYPTDVIVRSAFSGEIWKIRKFLKSTEYSGLSDRYIYKTLLKKNIKLNQEISSKVENFIASYFTKNTIGVHIRYTDRKTKLDRYPKIINRILESYPEASIFLATDNKKIEHNFKERYGKSKVFSTSKWYAKNSKYLHQNPECPDRFESGKQALIDMYLLSKCNQLIYDGRSTFGVIASLLSSHTNKESDLDITKYDLVRNIKYLGSRII